jgi:carbonic anhydrase
MIRFQKTIVAVLVMLLFTVGSKVLAKESAAETDRLSQLEQQVSQLIMEMEKIKAATDRPADATELPSPEKALEMLTEGNRRFVSGNSVYPRIDANRRLQTSYDGQHPFATIITCSDSRVPVEYIFDQGIGDIFTIRVAGNVCDVDEVGSIEYGVDHLETPVFVVLGHNNCGAVTAVVTEAELHGSIPALVDNIHPAVERAKASNPHLHGKGLVPDAIRENVWQSINDLYKASPAVCQRVNAGTLKVVGAIYDIGTGEVEWLGPHPSQSDLLTSATAQTNHGSGH